MLTFAFAKTFQHSLKRFDPDQKITLQGQVDSFMLAMDARQIPVGFGVKKIRKDIWEFRASLQLRVLFQWNGNTVTFLFIGSHNEVQQFLRHF